MRNTTLFPRGRLIASLSLLLLLALVYPAQALSIVDCGATGDGKTINTRSIQSAIDQVASRGGGTVSIPVGTFVSGTLRLRSHVDLHLESGAVLKGSDDLKDYSLDGQRVGLLFTQDVQDVAITGHGTIDGNGDHFMDLDHAKKLGASDTQGTRQHEHFRDVQAGLGDGPVVPKDRPFQMIIFSDCRKVTVQDVTLTNSPFWTLHFADCDGVTVHGVRVWCNLLVPNNDGMDFTCSSHVLVSDCDVRTGDDGLVFTGFSHHHELPGFKDLRNPCENVVVTNCTLQSRSSAIRIGGWDQNPMRNMTFSNITITDSNRGIGLFLRDEGSIENVTFSNIIIQTRLHTGDWWGNGEAVHLSAIRVTPDVKLGRLRNIRFHDLICDSEAGIVLYGTAESVIDNVTFDDVKLHISDSPLNAVAGGNFDLRPVLDPKLQLFSHDIPACYGQFVKNLHLRDFEVSWGDVREPFFTYAVEMDHSEGVTIDGFHGTAAPSHQGLPAINLHASK